MRPKPGLASSNKHRPFHAAEIMDALKKLKNNKTEGPDGIPAELLLVDISSIARILQPILQNIKYAGRACIDHSNILRLIVEQSIKWKSPLYITFVDFERAFDTVKREAIGKDTEIRVLHNDKLGEPLRNETGIRQGCPLSPLLFNIALDEIILEEPSGGFVIKMLSNSTTIISTTEGVKEDVENYSVDYGAYGSHTCPGIQS
ncbi:uncharacterized protein LOC129615119 [Condylostylus longicornis]|uniref:uncharacterized protein LOC129615119 n=1 Tax=Condylostylus longicornis TaxID=2530218 RepID=UPI00244E01BB|nr:uncharacterized protein LOC129615119 [Condylostylus longicornis]